MMNISVLDVPVLLASTEDAHQLVKHWSHLYNFGSRFYPAMAVSISLVYIFAALRSSSRSSSNNKNNSGKKTKNPRRFAFVLAAALTLTMAPYTWAFMSPTNNTLFSVAKLGLAGVTTPLEDIHALLAKWRWLHFVRSLFPLVGSILGFREALLL